MAHHENEHEPKPKLLNRQRVTAALTTTAALSVAIGGGVEALKSNTWELLSPQEKTARAEAHEVFDTLKATDVVKCSVGEITQGPVAFYQGKESPSIKITMDVMPGDKSNEPWFKAHKVGGYQAEIKWNNPSMNVSHDFGEKDGQGVPGAAVLAEEFTPKRMVYPRGVSLGEVEDSGKEVEIIIPFNDAPSFQGKRRVILSDNISPVHLQESRSDGHAETSEVRYINETCTTLDVDVQDGKVTVLSAQNTDGQTIEIKK